MKITCIWKICWTQTDKKKKKAAVTNINTNPSKVYLHFNPTIASFHPWLFLYRSARLHVAIFPHFFYHKPSICPPSPPALITPHYACNSGSCAPFSSVPLASVQTAKVEEEIDSKRDSHVMWRGTKEDPRSLGRLSATCSIAHTTVFTIALPHRPKTIAYLHPDLQPALARHAFVRLWLLSILMIGRLSSHLHQDLKPRVTGWKQLRQTGIIPEIKQAQLSVQMIHQASIRRWEMSHHSSRILPLHYLQEVSGLSIFLGP